MAAQRIDDDDDAPSSTSPGMGVIGRIRTGVDLERGSGEDGITAVYERNRHQRQIDRLHDIAARADNPSLGLSDDQYEAAKDLYETRRTAGLPDETGARNMETPLGEGSGPQLNQEALRKYEHLMKHIGREARACLTAIVIYDEDPARWGERMRCHGLGALQRHLDTLAKQLAWWEGGRSRKA